MQHQLVTTRPARPSRGEIEPAALALLSRHSAGLLATARRYSATPEDAEDAYQRGVEILLTKAPTTSETDLLPWLRTVVKHEAYAVRKGTSRASWGDEGLAGEADPGGSTDERAERFEQLRVGAEAMAGLKPQEIRCLLLKAEGLSYQEICEVTGFSYTKVNRCITEGRRSFLKRVAGIESGAECERLAPLISKVADGEASTDEMRKVRPHLKGCLACKATLREYRATPSRLAGLVPPVAALAGGGGKVGLVARLMERFGGVTEVAGAKVAAVAAAGVMLAGGSAAGVGALHHDAPAVAPAAYERTADGRGTSTGTESVASASPAAGSASASAAPDPNTAVTEAVANTPTTTSSEEGGTDPQGDSRPEFDPGTGTGSGAGTGSTDGTTSAQPNEFTAGPNELGGSTRAPSGSAPSGSAPSASTPAASTPSRSTPSGSAPSGSAPAASGAPAEFGP